MNMTTVYKNNAGLNVRVATLTRNTVIKFICRTTLDLFNQERLISPNINFYIKLMPS